ncbi:MAG: TlpA family protein disulfide reductase [Proteobacteria bacterium]|nr:TlpA family protein disulfide reductase [Pseudomonadota bacterium]
MEEADTMDRYSRRQCSRFVMLVALAAPAMQPATIACASSPSPSLAVGVTAPDFAARNAVSGEKFRLSALQGKVVVLTFWATWCEPCRKELPILEQFQRQAGAGRVVVLAVNFHEPPESYSALKRIARDWRLTLVDDWSGHITSIYRVESIPRVFVIGRDGRIFATHTGYGGGSADRLAEEINAAYNAGAPNAPDATREDPAQH